MKPFLLALLASYALCADPLFFLAGQSSSDPLDLITQTDTTLSAAMKGHIECSVPTCGYGFDLLLQPNPTGPKLLGFDVTMSQSITGFLLLSEFENSVYQGFWSISGAGPEGDGTTVQTRTNDAAFQIRFPVDTPNPDRWIQVFTTGANGLSYDFEATIDVVAIPDPAAVPEPATVGLWGLAAIAAATAKVASGRRRTVP